MRRFARAGFFLGACLAVSTALLAQTQINLQTQVRGMLPPANGGLGTQPTSGQQVPVSASTTSIAYLTLPSSCATDGAHALLYTGSAFLCQAITAVGNVQGSGTAGYLPVWTGADTLGNSPVDYAVTTSSTLTVGGASAVGFAVNGLSISLNSADSFSIDSASSLELYSTGLTTIYGQAGEKITNSDNTTGIQITQTGTAPIALSAVDAVTITAGTSLTLTSSSPSTLKANGSEICTMATGCGVPSNAVVTNPTATQTVVQPNGTTLAVNDLTITTLQALQQQTPATSSSNYNSPSLSLSGTYWNGSASANDVWSCFDALGSGSNPTSTLQCAQSGSSGVATFNVPNLSTGAFDSSTGDVYGGHLILDQITAATSTANQNSAIFGEQGQYWNGSVSLADQWNWQVILGSGSNPTSTYTLSHSGTTGVSTVNLPYSVTVGSLVSPNFSYNTAGGAIGNVNAGGAIPSSVSSSATDNTAAGYLALSACSSCSGNSAFGEDALTALTTGSGSGNVAVGYGSLKNSTTGAYNVAVGYDAGSQTTNTTGSNSVFVGALASPLSDGDTNEIAIGNGVIGAGSNTVSIGNSAITETVLNGTIYDGSAQIAASNLSNGTTGSGAVVLANGATLTGSLYGVGYYIAPVNTATSSQNYGSGGLNINGSYWNGSSAVTSIWSEFSAPNAIHGANPATNLVFEDGSNAGFGDSVIIDQENPATSSQNWNSPPLVLLGYYWNGSASASDSWEWQPVLGSGSNPTSTYTLTHTGTSGSSTVSIPYPVSASQYQVNGTALAASNLSNGTTGTGAVVLGSSPTIDSPTLTTHIVNSVALQHFSATLCVVGSTQYSACTTTATLPVAEPDTNYSATCSLYNANAGIVLQTYSKTTTTISFQLTNLWTQTPAGSIADCIVTHN